MATKVSAGVVILGVIGVAALGTLAVVLSSGGKKPPVPQPSPGAGYSVLPDCGGVTVTSEPDAIKYAENLGGQAGVYSTTSSTQWFVKAGGDLGIQISCNLSKVPKDSLVFMYKIFQAYLRGAIKAAKINETDAKGVISYLRGLLIGAGVDAAQLPEGLGV